MSLRIRNGKLKDFIHNKLNINYQCLINRKREKNLLIYCYKMTINFKMRKKMIDKIVVQFFLKHKSNYFSINNRFELLDYYKLDLNLSKLMI